MAKRSRAYRKMIKHYKKKLNAINKEAMPWDYGFFIEYFVAGLEFMQAYFELGENVVQTDDTATEIKETLKEAIDTYYQYEQTEYPSITSDLTKKELRALIRATDKERNRLWKKFWQLVQKNIQKWWD